MPLGEEEVDLVHLPVGQAEAVDFDILIVCRVDAAEVDHQLAIDKQPHVIVAGELEELIGAGVVLELAVQLEGEVEVVVGHPTGVAEHLAVDREEAAEVHVVGVLSIVKDVGSVILAHKGQHQRRGNVHPQLVAEPLVEAVGGGDSTRAVCAEVSLLVARRRIRIVHVIADLPVLGIPPLRGHLVAVAGVDRLAVLADRGGDIG